MPEPGALVEARNVTKRYPSRTGNASLVACQNVSISIQPGQTFGLAGASASGKSTIGRIILGLTQQDSGEVHFSGKRLPATGYSHSVRAQMQMVFQNPVASMNPRRTAAAAIELPMKLFNVGSHAERRERVSELMNLVGLSPRHAHYYPHEFSGGQCQRLGIARAIASGPSFIFLDEPVSALDVSIQAQILNLLKDLQDKLSLTYLFVANNLSVMRFMCDRLAIVQGGQIIEEGTTEDIFRMPSTEHARQLLSASI
jgi:ABC-type glutathione transport system ATPase component